jgi:hypothetical protein
MLIVKILDPFYWELCFIFKCHRGSEVRKLGFVPHYFKTHWKNITCTILTRIQNIQMCFTNRNTFNQITKLNRITHDSFVHLYHLHSPEYHRIQTVDTHYAAGPDMCNLSHQTYLHSPPQYHTLLSTRFSGEAYKHIMNIQMNINEIHFLTMAKTLNKISMFN